MISLILLRELKRGSNFIKVRMSFFDAIYYDIKLDIFQGNEYIVCLELFLKIEPK